MTLFMKKLKTNKVLSFIDQDDQAFKLDDVQGNVYDLITATNVDSLYYKVIGAVIDKYQKGIDAKHVPQTHSITVKQLSTGIISEIEVQLKPSTEFDKFVQSDYVVGLVDEILSDNKEMDKIKILLKLLSTTWWEAKK